MENNYCPECKVICDGKFCWRCGRRAVSSIVGCPYCDEKVTVIGQFCGNCGKPIQEAIQEHIKRERERGGENANSDTGNKDN